MCKYLCIVVEYSLGVYLYYDMLRRIFYKLLNIFCNKYICIFISAFVYSHHKVLNFTISTYLVN